MSREQVMDFYNNDSSRPFEMSFGQNGKTVGTMRFIGCEMKFEGEADSSASVFIDMIVKKQSAQWEEATSRISELEAKCAALAAENAALKDYLAPIGLKVEGAPATDAFLAEVRASAVDEACLKISNAIINCYQDEQIGLDAAATICGDFAAQLRQDANTAELVAAGIITKVGG